LAIFSAIFLAWDTTNQTKNRPTPKRGHDLSQELQLPSKRAYTGTKKEVVFTSFVACEVCGGKCMEKGHPRKHAAAVPAQTNTIQARLFYVRSTLRCM
jgi:DnaJ-class molecular chaperone